MTNQELVQLIRTKAADERRQTAEIVELIAQAIRQEIWAGTEHPDLYSWLTKECHYSNGSASRRIAAARLLLEVPTVADKIADGSASLTALAQTQTAIRLEEKRTGKRVSAETKKTLVESIAGQSPEQAMRTLALEFPEIRPAPRESFQAHGDGSWTLTIRLNDDQKRLLERLRETSSHPPASGTWGDLLSAACKDRLARVDPLERHARREARQQKTTEKKAGVGAQAGGEGVGAKEFRGAREASDALDAGVIAENSVSAPSATRSVLGAKTSLRIARDAVIARAGGRCEFRDTVSGRLCGSRNQITIDHVYPRALGGGDEIGNLRCLCAKHNRMAAEELLGISVRTVAGRRPRTAP